MVAIETAPIPDIQTEFGDKYNIVTSRLLPEFDTPGGVAYDVDTSNGASYYALVHHPTVPPRNDLYATLKKGKIRNLICPSDRGLMNVGGKQRLVTVFGKPLGGPLIDPQGALHPRLNSAVLRKAVTLSLLKVLAELHKRGFTHRSVIATRLYFASPESEEIVVGECYSAPPGYQGPDALEALRASFASPAARGAGTKSFDFFQMGAALQCLYFGELLWEGREGNSFVMTRVNQGSFWALGGGREIPGALSNLIRGLMADEQGDRWGAEDILDWFEGLAKPKRTTLTSWTMSKPTNFKGVAYVDRRLLSDAFASDPVEAARFLKTLDFPKWITMTLRDAIMSERVEKLLNVTPSDGLTAGGAADDKMVARVCAFLYPTGPVRYRGVSAYLDGVPGALAEAFGRDDKEMIKIFSELLDRNFLNVINEIVETSNPMFIEHIRAVHKGMGFAGGKQIARGPERMLYELNPILPCISQRFTNVWIGSMQQFMRALERMANTSSTSKVLLDPHIAAFCATHGGDLERDFNNLAAAQNDSSRLGSLTADFLGRMQRSLKLEALPNLTNSVIEGLGPLVKNLKNKKRREKVGQLLEKVKKGGDISKLTTAVNLSKMQAQDSREFSQAKARIFKMERERQRLMKKILPTNIAARTHGYKGSAMFAVLTFCSIAVIVFL